MQATFGARTRMWSLAVLTVLLASQLSGCGSDGNDSEPDVAATGEPDVAATGEPDVAATGEPDVAATGEPDDPATGEPDDPATGEPDGPATGEPDGPATGEPGEPTTGEAPSPFEGPEVEVVVGDCDALPLSNTRFSTDAFQPASLSVGAIHEGVVDPDISGASSNYWEVQLEEAEYIIVAETKTASGGRGNVGVSVNILNNNTGGDTVAVSINEIDYQSRGIALASINQPGSYAVSVDPKFGPEEYKILLASGDEQVPSPRFDECQTSSLALSTTKAGSLLGQDAPADADRWYRVDLETGTYDIESRAVNTSGRRTTIGYSVLIYGAYADDSKSLQVSRTSAIAIAAGASDSFTIERGGVFWVRIVNTWYPVDYELTISESEN